MGAHAGDIPPEGDHIRAEHLHLDAHAFGQLLAGGIDPPENLQAHQQHRGQKKAHRRHVEYQLVLHGAVGVVQFFQYMAHRFLPACGLFFIRFSPWSRAASMSRWQDHPYSRHLQDGRDRPPAPPAAHRKGR